MHSVKAQLLRNRKKEAAAARMHGGDTTADPHSARSTDGSGSNSGGNFAKMSAMSASATASASTTVDLQATALRQAALVALAEAQHHLKAAGMLTTAEAAQVGGQDVATGALPPISRPGLPAASTLSFRAAAGNGAASGSTPRGPGPQSPYSARGSHSNTINNLNNAPGASSGVSSPTMGPVLPPSLAPLAASAPTASATPVSAAALVAALDAADSDSASRNSNNNISSSANETTKAGAEGPTGVGMTQTASKACLGTPAAAAPHTPGRYTRSVGLRSSKTPGVAAAGLPSSNTPGQGQSYSYRTAFTSTRAVTPGSHAAARSPSPPPTARLFSMDAPDTDGDDGAPFPRGATQHGALAVAAVPVFSGWSYAFHDAVPGPDGAAPLTGAATAYNHAPGTQGHGYQGFRHGPAGLVPGATATGADKEIYLGRSKLTPSGALAAGSSNASGALPYHHAPHQSFGPAQPHAPAPGAVTASPAATGAGAGADFVAIALNTNVSGANGNNSDAAVAAADCASSPGTTGADGSDTAVATQRYRWALDPASGRVSQPSWRTLIVPRGPYAAFAYAMAIAEAAARAIASNPSLAYTHVSHNNSVSSSKITRSTATDAEGDDATAANGLDASVPRESSTAANDAEEIGRASCRERV